VRGGAFHQPEEVAREGRADGVLVVQHLLDRVTDGGGAVVLEQISARAGPDRRQHGLFRRKNRDDQNRQIGLKSGEGLDDLDSGPVGQADVHQREAEKLAPILRQRYGIVCSPGGQNGPAASQSGDCLRQMKHELRIVLDDQNAGTGPARALRHAGTRIMHGPGLFPNGTRHAVSQHER
jgi:hypothetical protein